MFNMQEYKPIPENVITYHVQVLGYKNNIITQCYTIDITEASQFALEVLQDYCHVNIIYIKEKTSKVKFFEKLKTLSNCI